MESFLFITDFDGTITAQDFFTQILYRFEHYKAFFSEKKSGFDLLKEVFEAANLTKEQFDEEVKHIPLDPSFVEFCGFIKKIGGDILILSAGFSYYIEKKLEFQGIKNVEVLANPSGFENGIFKMFRLKDERFYSKKHGVDKKKVVLDYKKKYEKIAYAGDSYVDFKACEVCDFKFAKGNLAKILKIFNLKFFEFKNFEEIKNKLSLILNI